MGRGDGNLAWFSIAFAFACDIHGSGSTIRHLKEYVY